MGGGLSSAISIDGTNPVDGIAGRHGLNNCSPVDENQNRTPLPWCAMADNTSPGDEVLTAQPAVEPANIFLTMNIVVGCRTVPKIIEHKVLSLAPLLDTDPTHPPPTLANIPRSTREEKYENLSKKPCSPQWAATLKPSLRLA